MIYAFLTDNYIFLFLLAGLVLILLRRKKAELPISGMWLTLICVTAMTIFDFAEVQCSTDYALVRQRTLWAVLGYWMRPACAYGLVMMISEGIHRRMMQIPMLLNGIVYTTALFSPMVFSYDQSCQFVRGPLGYTVFIVSFFYILFLLAATIYRFRNNMNEDIVLLVLCALANVGAALLEGTNLHFLLNYSILGSCIFFYLFLRTHATDRDPCTGLLNRQSYYEDIRRRRNNITAVASIDMNGLKSINDNEGHAAGDKALQKLARLLHDSSDRVYRTYRIGGDEFVLLFFNCSGEYAEKKLTFLKEKAEAAGCSIAAGLALRENGQEIEELSRISDHRMYMDKADYYADTSHDRRRKS